MAETWRAFTFDGLEGGDFVTGSEKEDTMFGSFEDLAGDFGIFDDLGLSPKVTAAIPPVAGAVSAFAGIALLQKYWPNKDSVVVKYAGILGGLLSAIPAMLLWKYQGQSAGMATFSAGVSTGLIIQVYKHLTASGTLGLYSVSDPVPVLQDYAVEDPVPVLQDYAVEEGMATVGGAPEFLSEAPEVVSGPPEVMSNWSPAFV